MRDILNEKLRVIRNRTRKSDTESEIDEEEIGDRDESDSEMEIPDVSERNGYELITTNPDDELKLHSDGELHTSQNKNKKLITESSFTRR